MTKQKPTDDAVVDAVEAEYIVYMWIRPPAFLPVRQALIHLYYLNSTTILLLAMVSITVLQNMD